MITDIVKRLRDWPNMTPIACKEAAAEIERLRHRNAALVEIVQDSLCPYDGRSRVVDCQQCGCSHGLLIRPIAAALTTGGRDD